MTESEQGPTTLHLIVPSPDGRSMLAQADLTGARQWHLPALELDVHDDGIIAPVLAAISALLGRVPILRIAPLGSGEDHHTAGLVAETEALAAPNPPPGLAWRSLADLDAAAITTAEVRPVVARWLQEQRRGSPSPKRPVWSKPGFVGRASEWLRAQLEAAGTPAIGEPRLTSLWGISAFLEAETAAGTVYLKSCAAVFATEPEITLAIDRALPGVGPAVVAIDPGPHWLLMRDVGGDALGKGPPSDWAPGLAAFGDVQRSWVEAHARLPPTEHYELEDRTPERLAAILPELVEDPVLAKLPPADRDRLRIELPRFVEGCARIAELGPPTGLVHGDFHPWNIHAVGGRYAIIDWSDSCLGHPFFDLPTFLGRTRDLAARRTMLDAYLTGWSEAYPRAALDDAAQLGLILGSLHQVESYRRIMTSLDPDDAWDLGSGAPNYARRALAWLDGGIDATPEDDHWSS